MLRKILTSSLLAVLLFTVACSGMCRKSEGSCSSCAEKQVKCGSTECGKCGDCSAKSETQACSKGSECSKTPENLASTETKGTVRQ